MRSLTHGVFLENSIPYTGRELRPHFVRQEFGLKGDAIAIWHGPCEVRGSSLVDLEDRDAGDFIRAADMLHVVVERFHPDLVEAVLIQRLLTSIAADLVREMSPTHRVLRNGDDVMVDGGKLTVSIATISVVSSLIHLGINIDSAGAPVKTASLNELHIAPAAFAAELVNRFASEIEGIADALAKVAPAHGSSCD